MENEQNQTDLAGQVYEIGYLLSPLLPEEKASELIEVTLRGVIERAGAQVGSQPVLPRIRPLAYSIAKSANNKKVVFKEAYFGAMRFEGEPETAELIKVELEKISDIIRFLLIKIPKSALKVQPRRIGRGPRPGKTPMTADGPKMTEAEIDQEIEGLLTTVEQ